MNSMPSKVIRKKACLQVKSPYGLSKDLTPKRSPNTWKNEKSKETKDSMKMEKVSVHPKIYDDHYTKQWIIIPMDT
jgi:hypothetical protein